MKFLSNEEVINYLAQNTDIKQGYMDFYKLIVKSNKKQIDSMIAEFNSRKKAHRMKNAKKNSTGVIDPTKLAQYKFTDEIFLSKTKLGDAKSHGFMMLLDWSASMNWRFPGAEMTCATASLIQTIIFSEFCSKAKIPYDSLTFTTSSNYVKADYDKLSDDIKEKFKYSFDEPASESNFSNWDYLDHLKKMEMLKKPVGLHLNIDGVQVTRLLSSEMSKSELELSKIKISEYLLKDLYNSNSLSYICTDKNEYDNFKIIDVKNSINLKNDYKKYFSSLHLMGGTPTMQALFIIESLMSKFKAKNKIEKLSVINLTDGDASDISIDEIYIDQNGEKNSRSNGFSVNNPCFTNKGDNYSSKQNLSQVQLFSGQVLNIEPYQNGEIKFNAKKHTLMGAFFAKIKKEYNASIICFYLYGNNKAVKTYLANARIIDSLKKFKDGNTGRFCIPDAHGYDETIMIKASSMNFKKEKINSENLSLKKNSSAKQISTAAAKQKNKDNSKFIAKKVMEIAA